MKKAILVSVASLFVFTGCSSTPSSGEQFASICPKGSALIISGYSADQSEEPLCKTHIPNNLKYARQHDDKSTVTALDVMNGLNKLSKSYADHGQQMLEESSKNMYYPQPTINSRPKRRTVNAQQIGDTTYFSDGTSWTRSGDNLIHSDGTTSYISGGYIYNPDGSQCYMSYNTLICD